MFRDMERHLIETIERAKYVVGCVAWMTNPRILAALAKKRGCLFVVQKEEFLRPDMGAGKDWQQGLREQYDALPRLNRTSWGDLISSLSWDGEPSSAVRCMGVKSSTEVAPRMHHKFLVFFFDDLVMKPDPHGVGSSYLPWSEDVVWEYGVTMGGSRWFDWTHSGGVAVWTGSYNLSVNSNRSLENAVLIQDKRVGQAYFREFEQIFALSEPLDWSQVWLNPEYKIGS